MIRRTFLSRFFAGVPLAGVTNWAQGPEMPVKLADVGAETELLADAVAVRSGVALILATRERGRPALFSSAALAHFREDGTRVGFVSLLDAVGPLAAPANNITLDHEGAAWIVRTPPRPSSSVPAEGLVPERKVSLMRRSVDGSSRLYNLDVEWTADSVVTAVASPAPGLVFCGIRSRQGAQIVRFSEADGSTEARKFPEPFGFYAFRVLPSLGTFAVAAQITDSKRLSVSSTMYVLDAFLRPAHSATAEGWMRDALVMASAGTPASLQVILTDRLDDPRLISLQSFQLPRLERSGELAWDEAGVPGSLALQKRENAVGVVRMQAESQRMLFRAAVPGARDLEIGAASPANERIVRVHWLRGGKFARALRESLLVVDGQVKKRLSLGPPVGVAAAG